ncbi:hypothetical protein [Desulfosediminicola flagellatus]|uniref:hypothetical protein n=1 Tax=Desulfosediminicola flagellatus TaxID=2569541 RepID=UPI0010AD9890|nr:hypothetical protein [Desulfosediminicola flagellatus]
MKIYTEVVIGIASGEVESETSFNHAGTISLCKGSGKVEETAQEKELAKISQEQWNEYETRFKPFEDEWIKNTEMDAGDQAKMAGQVNTGVGAVFDNQQREVTSQNFSAGMDPSSGRFKAAISGLSNRKGTAAAKAKTDASQAVDDQTYLRLQGAVAMGRGQSTGAMRDMTTLAGDATNKAIADAQSEQDTRSSIGSSLSSAAGMGLAGWKNSKRPQSTNLSSNEKKIMLGGPEMGESMIA